MGLLYDRLVRSPRRAALTWACLNLGLVLTILGQPVLAWTRGRPDRRPGGCGRPAGIRRGDYLWHRGMAGVESDVGTADQVTGT